MDQSTITIIGVIVVLVIVFFIARELFCWYWKINERISLMKEQNGLLKTLIRLKKSELKDTDENSDAPGDSDELKEIAAKEITVKHKKTQKTERISIAFWNNMKEEYGEDSFEIIEYHE